MSTHNKKYILWMVGSAIFAVLFGLLVMEPGPIERSKGSTVNHRRGKSKTVSTVKQEPATQNPTSAEPGVAEIAGAPAAGTSTDKGSTGTSGSSGSSRYSSSAKAKSIELTYTQLLGIVADNPSRLGSVVFENGSSHVMVKLADGQIGTVLVPEGMKSSLYSVLEAKGIEISAVDKPAPANNQFLYSFGPILFLGLIIFIIFAMNMRRQQSMMGGFGKSKARSADALKMAEKPITFADVGGCDEALRELMPIAKGLKRRHIYARAKAKLPKGVLLIGPPGTGKTLLAKATAGECDGTASIMAGSDFVEMLVGVGAARVRDEFRTGREIVKKTQKPRIIFIDEIDAIGGKRGNGAGASRNDEREQTLNALLVEMDGVEANDGLIVMAATNRADMLDEALMRPGRFDCHILVDKPDRHGREVIFGIHLSGMPVEEGIDPAFLADRTYGYTGADIAAICNKAGLLAAERMAAAMDEYEEGNNGSLEGFVEDLLVTRQDFDEAIDFVKYGAKRDKRQRAMKDVEKRNTAVHEAGHACIADVMPGSEPIVKITIMSRSRALGYVQQMPAEDRYSFTKEQAVARIVTMMAGRAAQELILGTCDTGAENDFQQATEMARKMVMSWGMSRVGTIAVGSGGGGGSMGFGGSPASSYGPELANEIDCEWRRIIKECLELARHIVMTDRKRIEALTERLMEVETVLGPEWQEFRLACPSIVEPARLQFDPARDADSRIISEEGEGN